MLRHWGLEFTDYCNLDCPHCPNSYSTVPKGFVSQEVVELAIQYGEPGQIFQMHGSGESLLHPKLIEYAKLIDSSDKGFFLSLSTNGLLLDSKMLTNLLDAGLNELCISLHVKKSVDALVNAIDVVTSNGKPIRLFATSFNGNTLVDNYIQESGVHHIIAPYMEPPTNYFTWSGTVKNTQVEFPPEVVQGRISRCR